jgi:hypothetical protein
MLGQNISRGAEETPLYVLAAEKLRKTTVKFSMI